MLVVTLPYPISANRYWRSRVIAVKGKPPIVSTYVSPEAKAYKTEVGWLLRAAGVRSPCPGRAALEYVLYPHRPQDWEKRMRLHGATWDDDVRSIDIDNANKVLIDALKGIAIHDDSRKWVRRLAGEHGEPDALGARLVLTIKPIRAAVAPVVQSSLDLPEPAPLRAFDPLDV
jgi:crossover junction endodeoxyribonuclease RusA